MDIPEDVRKAAWKAYDMRLPSLINKEAQEAAYDAIVEAIMAERQRCYDIVHCGCGKYCDLDEAADKIILSGA